MIFGQNLKKYGHSEWVTTATVAWKMHTSWKLKTRQGWQVFITLMSFIFSARSASLTIPTACWQDFFFIKVELILKGSLDLTWSDYLNLLWKFKLQARKFAWGVKSKHYWKQKVCWHHSAMVKVIVSNPGYLLKYFLLYVIFLWPYFCI